ncbi:UNVERIFIED_CONTAM: hypothetical protein GTU68_008032, partial [Idotea baltica]|nr:hypothetical protein [Idotea baltica]
MRALSDCMSPTHPLRPCMDIIESKIPAELLDQMRRMQAPDSPHADVPSEKALVRLHKQLLKALQHHRRVDTQWGLLVSTILCLEDKHRSAVSVERLYQHSNPPNRPAFINRFYTPRIEWYWECVVRCYLLRGVG